MQIPTHIHMPGRFFVEPLNTSAKGKVMEILGQKKTARESRSVIAFCLLINCYLDIIPCLFELCLFVSFAFFLKACKYYLQSLFNHGDIINN